MGWQLLSSCGQLKENFFTTQAGMCGGDKGFPLLLLQGGLYGHGRLHWHYEVGLCQFNVDKKRRACFVSSSDQSGVDLGAVELQFCSKVPFSKLEVAPSSTPKIAQTWNFPLPLSLRPTTASFTFRAHCTTPYSSNNLGLTSFSIEGFFTRHSPRESSGKFPHRGRFRISRDGSNGITVT